MYVSLDAKEKIKMRQKGQQDGYGSVSISNIWKTQVECELQATHQDKFKMAPSKFILNCKQTIRVRIAMKTVVDKWNLGEVQRNQFILRVTPVQESSIANQGQGTGHIG